jgi:hypothetical protein
VLDFAMFDCSACHHELMSPSWRQERGFSGTPGRPVPRTGPMTLLRSFRGDQDAFEGKFSALVKASDVRPFGDPATMGSAARDLTAWADGLAKGLDQAHYDDARVLQLRRVMADAGRRKGRGLDYDDAQQLFWAFDALKDESPAVSPDVAGLLAGLSTPPTANALLLGRLWVPGSSEPGKRPLIATLLPERLRKASQYRPDAFREAFERIAGQLGSSGR